MSQSISLGKFTPNSRRMIWRRIQASWRDTRLLIRQFRWPLRIFIITIIGGGLLYYYLSQGTGSPVLNPLAAIYQVLALTFLQSGDPFPSVWYLEIFYFLMPLIGISILAHGLTEFGVMLFNRQGRNKEWQMAVASTFKSHIILIGLGHLGFRVARDLAEMTLDVVIVEKNPQADLVANAKDLGIPVIQDDASREQSLEAAGIRRARAIILCTQNDALNLKIALKARRLHPHIQVVLRIFDDDFSQALQEQFNFKAFSATAMAAPAFAAAAAGVDMTRPITVEGTSLCLARFEIPLDSRIAGFSVEQIEQQFNVSVVLLKNSQLADLHPPANTLLASGDSIAILGSPQEINQLASDIRVVK
jgi:voltage-gated potassium channel